MKIGALDPIFLMNIKRRVMFKLISFPGHVQARVDIGEVK